MPLLDSREHLNSAISATSLMFVAAAPLGCMKLTGTKMCPSFAEYEFYRGDDKLGLRLDSVQQFDDYIASRLPYTPAGISAFKTNANCSGFNGAQIPFYQTTFCGIMIDAGKKVGNCSQGQNIKQVCKTSASVTLEMVNQILNDVKQCTPGANRQSSFTADFAQFISNNGSSTDSSCLVNQENEGTCGLSNATIATSWCAWNTNNSCCVALANKQTNFTTISGVPTSSTASFSAPTSTSSSKANEASENSSYPLIISASIGGAALLAICLFGFYYFMKKNRSEVYPISEKSFTEPAQLAETVKVIYEYSANLFDEINLSVGDTVIVKCKFDDGWAFGFNMETKEEGSFPLACVSSLDKDSSTAPTRDSWAPSKRASSLIAPSSSATNKVRQTKEF